MCRAVCLKVREFMAERLKPSASDPSSLRSKTWGMTVLMICDLSLARSNGWPSACSPMMANTSSSPIPLHCWCSKWAPHSGLISVVEAMLGDRVR